MRVFVDECVTKLLMPHLVGHDFIHILDTPLRSTKNGALAYSSPPRLHAASRSASVPLVRRPRHALRSRRHPNPVAPITTFFFYFSYHPPRTAPPTSRDNSKHKISKESSFFLHKYRVLSSLISFSFFWFSL
jgi:hypothetical protein